MKFYNLALALLLVSTFQARAQVVGTDALTSRLEGSTLRLMEKVEEQNDPALVEQVQALGSASSRLRQTLEAPERSSDVRRSLAQVDAAYEQINRRMASSEAADTARGEMESVSSSIRSLHAALVGQQAGMTGGAGQ